MRARVARWRGVSAAVGVAAIAAGLWPVASMDFRVHVGQHLLMAMAGPALIALGAPVTTAFRLLHGTARRRLVRLVHSRWARVVGSGPVVLLLEVGGMYAWYLTPLYGYGHAHPWVATLAHLHMVAAGLLFAWYVLGVDPPAHGLGARIVVLVVAGGAHDLLAKLLYARGLPHGAGDVRAGAQLMYAGGTVVELVLAVGLMAGWYARTGRRLRHERRRATRGTPAGRMHPVADPTPQRIHRQRWERMHVVGRPPRRRESACAPPPPRTPSPRG